MATLLMAGKLFNQQSKGSKRGRSALRLFLIVLISGTVFAGVVFAADYAVGTYSSGTYGGGIYGTGDATPPTTPAPSGGGGQIVGSGPTAPGYVNTNPTGTSTALAITATTTASTSLPATLTTPTASSTPTTTPRVAASVSSSPFLFNRQLWDEGPDILALQEFLNTHGFALVATGWGSPGNEIDTFGPHTYRALIKFQSANNLPPTGYFGPLTRALINSQIH